MGLEVLERNSSLFDTSRVFLAGCGRGASFAANIGSCLAGERTISSLMLHVAGLNITTFESDPLHLQTLYSPLVPQPYGSKLCMFDSTISNDTSMASFLMLRWRELGGTAEVVED